MKRDFLDESLAPLLETQRWGRAHRHGQETGSTNDDMLTWLQEGAEHGSLITADRQHAGRGRLGRRWDSGHREDLYASVALRVTPGPAGIGALGLAVGLGLLEGLAALAPDFVPDLGTLALKWPNDLLLNNKKLGGVLCEARWNQGQAMIACGFGVNLGRDSFEEVQLAQRATSLALTAREQGKTLPENLRARVLASLLMRLETRVEQYLHKGFSGIEAAYRQHCRELGQMIRLSGQGPDKGPPGTLYRAIDLDHDGALLVQRPPSLRRWRVQSDDVWLVAPPDSAENT